MSAAGNKHRDAQRGLTLVEMLVVVGIMALMGAVVVLTLPARTSSAQEAAMTFARAIPGLADRAITGGRPLGLSDEDGLTVHVFDQAWEAQGALPLADRVSAALTASDEILAPDPEPEATLIVYRPPGEDEEKPVPAPPILFAPTGEVTPFTARFDDGRYAWLVVVGPFGAAEVTRER